MANKLDLNCDMGESFGCYRLGHDAEIMPYITSANIACGFHAGDGATMTATVRLALKHDVAIGAHPGLPDLQGFGRREMAIRPAEARQLILMQVGALQAIAKAEGGKVVHVKPHGALYNMAARDTALASAIARAIADLDDELILVGLAGSELIRAGTANGLMVANEVFADRTYQPDGQLTLRTSPRALIEDPQQSLDQILEMVRHNQVTPIHGAPVTIQADTLCLHGDGPHAVAFARNARRFLDQQGITVQALS